MDASQSLSDSFPRHQLAKHLSLVHVCARAEAPLDREGQEQLAVQAQKFACPVSQGFQKDCGGWANLPLNRDDDGTKSALSASAASAYLLHSSFSARLCVCVCVCVVFRCVRNLFWDCLRTSVCVCVCVCVWE
jgi:hypothetical protein